YAHCRGKPNSVNLTMVHLRTKPQNHPSVFYAPCVNITTARVSLRMSGTTPPFVATSQSIMTTSTPPPRVSVGLPSCSARCGLSNREDRGQEKLGRIGDERGRRG